MNLMKTLERAISWRQQHPQLKHRTTLRWCAGLGDHAAGWIVDGYGDLVIAHHYLEGDPEQAMGVLEQTFPDRPIFLKARSQSGSFEFFANEQLVDGQRYRCDEKGSKYWIQPTEEHDNGLFLDTHAARQWVRKHSEGQNVLNLFAYTCAFGVAAKMGGADALTNIDPNQDYLNWGKANAELNGVDFRNLKDTTQKYLPRHVRRVSEGKDQPYDFIITDPPAFLVGRGKDRLGRKIWPSMLEQMEQSGCRQFLLICNDRSFRETREWHPFLGSQLKKHYRFFDLPQSADVLGQDPVDHDPHYAAPIVTVANCSS
jgi:23S rRNA G2069 N7-methylase RlmK/C1962 C5-methylase RlmI